ncbi:MAG TPA: STAS domain-containing protein [Candidatus Angelobacter sp.]|nr:STAS domain-containing protein [Candidatus Angelobacter sp.]
MALKITVENHGEETILRCQGRIIRGDDTTLLEAAIQQETHNIVLDFCEVEAIDAAGIGALVVLQAAGIYLKLINPNEQIRGVLKLTKLDTIIEIDKSKPNPEVAMGEWSREGLPAPPGASSCCKG